MRATERSMRPDSRENRVVARKLFLTVLLCVAFPFALLADLLAGGILTEGISQTLRDIWRPGPPSRPHLESPPDQEGDRDHGQQG